MLGVKLVEEEDVKIVELGMEVVEPLDGLVCADSVDRVDDELTCGPLLIESTVLIDEVEKICAIDEFGMEVPKALVELGALDELGAPRLEEELGDTVFKLLDGIELVITMFEIEELVTSDELEATEFDVSTVVD